MLKILDQKEMAKENIGHTESHQLFIGDMKYNTESNAGEIVPNTTPRLITVAEEKYNGSEGFAKLWNEIETDFSKLKANVSAKKNAMFDADTYYSLIDKLRIDVTRRRFEYRDFTAVMNNEINNPRFSKAVTLGEFLPYAAAFEENSLAGEGVGLAQQNLGAAGSVTMQGYAVGFADNLENRLYNQDIFSLQRLNEAIARGYTAKRNDLSVGLMVAKTTATAWAASQQVAADTTGTTAEDKLYITLDSAIEKLTGLKDPQTGQYIDTSAGMVLMCNPTDMRRIGRAINGQLTKAAGAVVNREPLREISTIFDYAGDSIKMDKKTYTYGGCAAKKAYLFVPKTGYTLVKRPVTQQISQGDALTLSTEKYSWYFVQTSYTGEFFGSSDSTVFAAVGAGYGFVVEITLP